MELQEKISSSVYHDMPIVVLVEGKKSRKVDTVQGEEITREIVEAYLFRSIDFYPGECEIHPLSGNNVIGERR